MVISMTANKPKKFSGQTASYASGVANTLQEKTIKETANAPITFSSTKIIYAASGTGTSGLQQFTSS